MKYRMSEGLANNGEVLKEAMERTPKPRDIEQEFIDAWNAGKVRRVSDGAKPWVGLTEEDIDDAEIHLTSCRNNHESWIEGIQEFAQAIEAKLKEKNNA